MSESDGLICAYLLDGRGGATAIGWPEIRAWNPGQGCLWVHLERTHAEARRWLGEESGLDPLLCEALLAEEVRPRSHRTDGGLLVILRGVNLNAGAEPDDMLSLRMWVDRERIITLRLRHLKTIEDVRERLTRGDGPASPGQFLLGVSTRIVERIDPVVEQLNDEVDEIEDRILSAPDAELHGRLAIQRRQTIRLRRYLMPERDALARIYADPTPWLAEAERARLREVLDRITRYVEDLDALRERSAVIQEELASRQAERMNRTMYTLSLVAAIFLPLGLVTGLLGINVGGIPWADNPLGFELATALLAGVAGLQIWFFRRRHLF